MEKRWIWEFNDYPNFRYKKDELSSLISDIRFLQGELSAIISFAPKEILEEKLTDSYADEIINSSAIEGEFLNRDSVRESIAKRLGFDRFANTDYATDGLVNILVDACTNYEENLDIERIFIWHGAVFPTGRNNKGEIVNVGKIRDDYDMIISGGGPKEITYYEAPPHNILTDQLVDFFDWFNKTEDSIIKAAIAQLWFLVIHPLDDGNGRIARTICEYVLARVENSYYSKIYSISKTIYENKKGYYEVLEKTTGFRKKDEPLDITDWLKHFLETLLKSLQEAKGGLQYIREKTNFWDVHRDKKINARQTKVLNKILDKGAENFEGGLSKQKYVAIAKTSTSTASNDIKQLIKWGCITQVPETTGRGTRYTINNLSD